MKKVLINTNFKDVYTGTIYIAGKYAKMTDERIAEIKTVDSNFVTVVGNVETPATKNKVSKSKNTKPKTPATNDLDKTPKNGTIEDITK